MGDRTPSPVRLAALVAVCAGCTVALDWDRAQLASGDASVDVTIDSSVDVERDAARDAAPDVARDAPPVDVQCTPACAAPLVCAAGACACPNGMHLCAAPDTCRECCVNSDCTPGRCCNGTCCHGAACAGCPP